MPEKRQGCILRFRFCLIMIGGTKGPCISARANQKGSRRPKQKFRAYQAVTNGWKSDQVRLPFAVHHLPFDDISRKELCLMILILRYATCRKAPASPTIRLQYAPFLLLHLDLWYGRCV